MDMETLLKYYSLFSILCCTESKWKKVCVNHKKERIIRHLNIMHFYMAFCYWFWATPVEGQGFLWLWAHEKEVPERYSLCPRSHWTQVGPHARQAPYHCASGLALLLKALQRLPYQAGMNPPASVVLGGNRKGGTIEWAAASNRYAGLQG